MADKTELGHYYDRATAVRLARATVAAHQAPLIVQWRGGVELLAAADVVHAIIASELPDDPHKV